MRIMDAGRPAEILLVEDNEDDVLITQRGFRNARFTVHLHNVPNGQECMSFLRQEGDYSGVPRPDLILLDLNLPVMDGREFLGEIVKDDDLRRLPVVILTPSADERDFLAMYDLRCSLYITKPVNVQQF